MTFNAIAKSILIVFLSGCSTDSRSIRIQESEGPLPANAVPEVYKAGVAEEVHKLQGGSPKVLELRISQPFSDVLTGSWVEVAVKIPAVISVGDPSTKCYKVKFSGQYVIAMRPAELDGCSGGMEDMLAYYQTKYPA